MQLSPMMPWRQTGALVDTVGSVVRVVVRKRCGDVCQRWGNVSAPFVYHKLRQQSRTQLLSRREKSQCSFRSGRKPEDRVTGSPVRFSGMAGSEDRKFGIFGNILKINTRLGKVCARSCVEMFPRVGETSPHSVGYGLCDAVWYVLRFGVMSQR